MEEIRKSAYEQIGECVVLRNTMAFIHAYTLVNGRPPAEADMILFFRVIPPTIHQMVLSLEKAGLISRKPGVPRSIAVPIGRSALPELNPGDAQPVKITVTGY